MDKVKQTQPRRVTSDIRGLRQKPSRDVNAGSTGRPRGCHEPRRGASTGFSWVSERGRQDANDDTGSIVGLLLPPTRKPSRIYRRDQSDRCAGLLPTMICSLIVTDQDLYTAQNLGLSENTTSYPKI